MIPNAQIDSFQLELTGDAQCLTTAEADLACRFVIVSAPTTANTSAAVNSGSVLVGGKTDQVLVLEKTNVLGFIIPVHNVAAVWVKGEDGDFVNVTVIR